MQQDWIRVVSCSRSTLLLRVIQYRAVSSCGYESDTSQNTSGRVLIVQPSLTLYFNSFLLPDARSEQRASERARAAARRRRWLRRKVKAGRDDDDQTISSSRSFSSLFSSTEDHSKGSESSIRPPCVSETVLMSCVCVYPHMRLPDSWEQATFQIPFCDMRYNLCQYHVIKMLTYQSTNQAQEILYADA